MAHQSRHRLIYLQRQVLATWQSEVASWCRRETGGMLLGYETVSGELVITQATRPGPKARHRWLSFEPDEEFDRRAVEQAYGESGRIVTYLGEWHSHVLGMTRPSSTDVQTMRRIADDPAARVPEPISAIVSQPPRGALRWTLYALDELGLVAQDVRVIDSPLSW